MNSIKALVGTGIPLGIIPRGTANAFATALGIPQQITAACQTILAGKTRTIDVAVCNRQLMLSQVDIGLVAGSLEQADRQAKNRFGRLAYIFAGFKQLRQLKLFVTKVETEEQTIHSRAVAVTIANAAPLSSLLAQKTAADFSR